MHEGFRFFSYLLLILSLYLGELDFFKQKGIWIPEFEGLFEKLLQLIYLVDPVCSKAICMGFLIITCIGTRSKKDRELKVSALLVQLGVGLFVYWGALFLNQKLELFYLVFSFTGFVILNIAFDNISKLINVNLMKDRFNLENESFSQEETFMENEYSVNLPSLYQHKGREREGWINIVNPFRASVVIGTPGSGKSFSLVLPFIKQHLEKGFAMCVYDFKFPDLTKVVYHHFLKAKRRGKAYKQSQYY
jgi:hypothetical protein